MNHKMTVYYKCNMRKQEHFCAYVFGVILLTAIAYLFYHLISVSIVLGIAGAFFFEKMYAQSTIVKRQRALRMQFKDFLEAMSVAVSAGNVEAQAVKSAWKDLKIAYNDRADIVKEVGNIILQYEQGGKQLKTLFEDFGRRSGLEDIRSFATIYSVIEGKSDRFGDILVQTQEIIGDKIAIEQEIQTMITSAKSEVNMMLIMPVVIVVAMSAMGGGLLDALFTTAVGHIAATAALLIFALSYAFARKCSNVEV